MSDLQWADDDGVGHLHKRIEYGDLPAGCSLEEYESIILHVARSGRGYVYEDPDDRKRGGAICILTEHGGVEWFVKVYLDATIRTAFPPVLPRSAYVRKKAYHYLGRVGKLRDESSA